MRVRCSYGTPAELETVTKTQAGLARAFLREKLRQREKWAERFNGEVKRRCASAREQVDGLDLTTIPVGDVRRWTIDDDVTGVTFVFELEVILK